MASVIQISSLSGNPPFDVYISDFYGNNEQFLTTLTQIAPPIVNIILPSGYTSVPIIRLKIIDSDGCQVANNEICAALPSLTPTSTPTNTPTNTITSTVTLTNTQTPTPSVTPTTSITPSITQTPTLTPTITTSITPTLTPTPTTTITPTITSTETPTLTPTNSETPTNTPTNTETPTPTPTPFCFSYTLSTSAELILNYIYTDCAGNSLSDGIDASNSPQNICATYDTISADPGINVVLNGQC